MSEFLFGLVKVRWALAPRAILSGHRRKGKPPKSKVGAAQSAFVLTVMSLAVLWPSGWVIDDKSRD